MGWQIVGFHLHSVELVHNTVKLFLALDLMRQLQQTEEAAAELRMGLVAHDLP